MYVCTFSQRILTNLINSDREKYISYPNGREVMNWMAINTDVKKIEKICHGTVPGPNDDLQDIIKKHDSQEKLGSSFASSTSSRSNVVKELWAKKGVTFPGTGPISQPSRYSIPVPQTPEEEHYQINVALRESQKNTLLCTQSDQLSFSHARSTARAPIDLRFPQDCTAVNFPCQAPRSTYTYTSTNNASEENALSLLYNQSDQLSISHARWIARAPAHFRLPQDCTAVNVPCPVPSSTYTCTGTKNASEENALSLLANLLSDNSTE